MVSALMESSEQDLRRPRFLVMDNTPLSLLGMIEALDWFFVPGGEVVITDMVVEEATRDPGPDRDPRKASRAYISTGYWPINTASRSSARPRANTTIVKWRCGSARACRPISSPIGATEASAVCLRR